MKRLQWLVLIAAALAAAALRVVQLQIGFEASGLAIPGCWAGIALPLLLAAAAMVFVLSSHSFPARRTLTGPVSDSFLLRDPFCLLCCAAGAGVAALSAVLAWLEGSRSILDALLLLFGAAAAAAVLYVSFALSRGSGAPLGVGLLIPVCFLVLRLVLLYRESAADPVLMRTYVDLLAAAALTLSALERAAFAFRAGAPRVYVPAGAMAVILSLCAIAAFPSLPQLLFFAGYALTELGFLAAADFEPL